MSTAANQMYQCATLQYNQAKHVCVESAFIRALPGFSIVGMAQQSIQESKERIKSALTSVGFKFPPQKITVNMSPSDLKKEGSHFDLGVALLLYFQKSEFTCKQMFIFGELGLEGQVRTTASIFPIVLALAAEHESLEVLVPKELAKKIAQIPNVTVYAVASLQEAVDFFENFDTKEPFTCKQNLDESHTLTLEGKRYFYHSDFPLDFLEVKGQSRLKRAMVIAAAGMHNLLLEGSPGCGKSMSVKRLAHILAPMSMQEMLEANAYESLMGEDKPLDARRPFRSPHHSSSKPSIFGGGSTKAMAGECALAHNGILFFDEFPHFTKSVLESLREPLEDQQVLISRVNTKIKYNTKFLFIAAQNPCPCGNLLSKYKECRCNELEIQRYKNRLSEPLLDRIDIYIQVLEESNLESTQSSAQMFEMVLKAFAFQKKRGQSEFNAKLQEAGLESIANLDEEAVSILEKARVNFGLSHRSIFKCKSLARTIADIDESDCVQKEHMLEALSYRRR